MNYNNRFGTHHPCEKCSPEENMKRCFSCQACEKDTQLAWTFPDLVAQVGKEYGMCPKRECQEYHARFRKRSRNWSGTW